MKILLAEDDSSIQTIARMTLQKVGGHEVVAVENGLLAIEMAEKEPFDLIILDGMMPELDGFETCRRLKANPQTQHIPIIFLTAKNQQSDLEEGTNVGAIGYIVKPFDAKDLCQLIQKMYDRFLWDRAA